MLQPPPDSQRKEEKTSSSQALTIALTARWQTFPDRFRWILDNGFALEYSANPESLDLLPQHVDSFLEYGVPVRYHALFPGYEIGHEDETIAERATLVHMETLKALQNRVEAVITLHVGFNPRDKLIPERIVANLSKIVALGKNLGVTVCLENLRRGLTSNPENVLKWASAAGAMITLDIGHAVSCELVQKGELKVTDFVDMFAPRLFEAHMYERETDRHHPPKDLSVIGPVVERLLTTKCHWWTIELDDYEEALDTRKLLRDFLTPLKIATLP
ncbi:MAG: TIM barrel protein [Chloroflexota bacterium]